VRDSVKIHLVTAGRTRVLHIPVRAVSSEFLIDTDADMAENVEVHVERGSQLIAERLHVVYLAHRHEKCKDRSK
jgi:hypothetical protein